MGEGSKFNRKEIEDKTMKKYIKEYIICAKYEKDYFTKNITPRI